jgi:hypothetical protein
MHHTTLLHLAYHFDNLVSLLALYLEIGRLEVI